jgi:hypothetical protein
MPPLCELAHPLIKHFNEQFEGGGGTLEKISSVSDNVWWKQKSGRWRGAAAVATKNGEDTAWLAAAGLRADGDDRDFYANFAARSSTSSDAFLPQPEDVELERIDHKIARRDAWVLQVHVSALALLANAMRTGAAGPLIIQSPDQQNVLSLTMNVSTVEEAGEILSEVIVAIKQLSFGAGQTAKSAVLAVLASIQAESSEWQIGLLANDIVSYATLVPDEIASRARHVEDRGELPDDSQMPQVRVGTRAHYAHQTGLTQATVDGEPVEALCGYWFVPMHDHGVLEVCEKCVAVRDILPE